jgi:hypothetical protein
MTDRQSQCDFDFDFDFGCAPPKRLFTFNGIHGLLKSKKILLELSNQGRWDRFGM